MTRSAHSAPRSAASTRTASPNADLPMPTHIEYVVMAIATVAISVSVKVTTAKATGMKVRTDDPA